MLSLSSSRPVLEFVPTHTYESLVVHSIQYHVVLSSPTHSCVPSTLYLPTGSLTTPPSRRGFTYKGCQTKWVSRGKKTKKKRCHLRIAKTENKKNSNERIGQHQVKDLIDKLKGWPIKTSKKNKLTNKEGTQKEPKEWSRRRLTKPKSIRLKTSWIKSICNWHWKSSSHTVSWARQLCVTEKKNSNSINTFFIFIFRCVYLSHHILFLITDFFLIFFSALKNLKNTSRKGQFSTTKSINKCIWKISNDPTYKQWWKAH